MRKKAAVSSKTKAKVALEAIKGLEPLSAIAKRYKVHPIQVGKWRKKLLAGASIAFDEAGEDRRLQEAEDEIQQLYEQIGRLKIENDFLKKKSEDW